MHDLLKYLEPAQDRQFGSNLSWVDHEVRQLGFDHVLLAMQPCASLRGQTPLIHSNYPQRWRGRYEEQGFANIDPTVKHCFQRRTPLIWRDTTFRADKVLQSFYEEARAHGLEAGVTLPIRDEAGAVGMLTCTYSGPIRDFDQLAARQLPQLSLLKDVVSEVLRKVDGLHSSSALVPGLSVREKECLQWHAAGKTSWEIGRILNVTEACVNFHFTKIRQKFKVTHRHEAMLKALQCGLIEGPDTWRGQTLQAQGA